MPVGSLRRHLSESGHQLVWQALHLLQLRLITCWDMSVLPCMHAPHGSVQLWGKRVASLGRIIERGKERVGWESERRDRERNEVRVIAPSLLLSGLFPGDAILEVNGESSAPVERVVEAITRVLYHLL